MILSISKDNTLSFTRKAFIFLLMTMITLSTTTISFSADVPKTDDTVTAADKICIDKNKATGLESIPAKNCSTSICPFSIIIKIIIALAILGFSYAVLICLPYLKAFQSPPDMSSVIEHVGEGKGSKKVLIGYVTRKGAAASIAEKMYEVLKKKGLNVDLRYIPNIGDDDISKYDSYILGSAVYWTMAPEYTEFLIKNRELLSKKKVVVFATCLTIQRETEKNFERVDAYYESALKHVPEIKPIEKVAFTGNVDMSKINFPERQFLHFLFTITPLQGGDHRDFTKVTKWAEKISDKL